MKSYGKVTGVRLVKIRHFLYLTARGDRVKKGGVIVDDTAAYEPPKASQFCSIQRCTRQFATLVLKKCAVDRPPRISAESFDFTDGSSINEGLQENLRRLGWRLLHSFHEPRESWGRISTRRAFRNTPEHSTEILGSNSSTEHLRGR